MLNKHSEIGSEFWIESFPQTLLHSRDGVYCLSGRTAIDLIINDIQKRRAIRRVYMPAWCCDSMLAPFIDREIEVKFYDVSYSNGNLEYIIDDSYNCDIFYLTNYFGYDNTLSIINVQLIKEHGCFILYDRTHSFLMDDLEYREIADYSFASIRKWIGVLGGAVIEGLNACMLNKCPYLSVKEQAMMEKSLYMNGASSVSKEDFLEAFKTFAHLLVIDYHNYEMDDLSYTIYKQVDFESIKNARYSNAELLHNELRGINFISDISNNSAPLFVPILFESKNKRDLIRSKLIESDIYCPIHWPRPMGVGDCLHSSDIYDRELSVVCDQRYSLEHMMKIIKVINNNI